MKRLGIKFLALLHAFVSELQIYLSEFTELILIVRSSLKNAPSP